MNIVDFFDHSVSQYPNRCCLTDGQRSLSFQETQAFSHRICLALQANQIDDGSKSPSIALIILMVFSCN